MNFVLVSCLGGFCPPQTVLRRRIVASDTYAWYVPGVKDGGHSVETLSTLSSSDDSKRVFVHDLQENSLEDSSFWGCWVSPLAELSCRVVRVSGLSLIKSRIRFGEAIRTMLISPMSSKSYKPSL